MKALAYPIEKTVPQELLSRMASPKSNSMKMTESQLLVSKLPSLRPDKCCYVLIHTLYNKTPYELVHDKKPDLSFLRIFGALCYPTNDSKDLGKLKAKADIGFFVGYAPNRKGYRIYNKRTRQIMETIHVTFDELTEQTAPVHSSSGPNPNLLTPGPISSGLVPNFAPAISYVPPTNKDLELLFQPLAIWPKISWLRFDIMADVNAPVEQAPAVAPPTRTDEQILPRIR
ncbi:retrovirus-related pol polyprotein from transposon TNT 1-94 [Tanacetum coccineum]